MISVASDVLGTFGAVFWSVQLLPQIWINYRRPSHTKGLQPSMMLFWAAAAVPLGIYNILSRKAVALQIQPQILASLSLVTWGQVYYYGHSWSLAKCLAVVAALGALGAGVQLLGVLPYLLLREDGRAPEAYLSAMAILSAIGLGLGVLRHYWDIYTHRSVRGISFLFCFLDAAGDLTSLLSVAIVEPVDVQGAVIYGVELALWTGIFALGALFNLRYWLKGELGEDGSHVPNAVDLDDPAATGGIEGADTSLDQNVDASSSIHSTSSRSVFRTVGLRQRALKVIRVRADHVP